MTDVNLFIGTLEPYRGVPSDRRLDLTALYPPEVGCAITVPTYEVRPTVATLTDDAFRYIARGAAEGLAFQVQDFIVGESGYNPTQWTKPLPVYPTTTIMAQRYEGPITNTEQASTDGTVWAYTCAIPASYLGTIGELALVAEILHSPDDPGEVGTRFVYAIAHCAGVAKHQRKASTFRLLIRGG